MVLCKMAAGEGFLASTEILLDRNKTLTIEHLEENDKIVGWHGAIGTVSSERPGFVAQNDIMVFGFNDDKPFFSAFHPFWTHDGWRAIDPSVARKENKWLEVGQLVKGDYVRKIKGNNRGTLVYEWVKVERFNSQRYPAGTRFHAVHTRQGPRSYHANGYLVCQNYREITIQTLNDGLQTLSLKEQQNIKEQFKKLQPSFEKMLGRGPAREILSFCETPLGNMAKMSSTNADSSSLEFHTKDLTLPPMQLSYKAGNTECGAHSMPTKLDILKGHLFLDDQYVPAKSFEDRRILFWTRAVANGMWEHGCMKLLEKNCFGKGQISLTTTKDSTNVEHSISFSARNFANVYRCYKGPVQPSDGNSTKQQSCFFQQSEKSMRNDEGWEETGLLEMGIECGDEGCGYVGRMSILPKLPDLSELGGNIKFGDDEYGNSIVNVELPSMFASYSGYVKFYGAFSWDFASFSGYCTVYDENQPGMIGESYDWKGEVKRDSEGLLEAARQEHLKNTLHDKKQLPKKMLPSAMAYQMKRLVKEGDLSVQELYLLTVQSPDATHQQVFQMLQKIMKHDMDTESIRTILNQLKPPLRTDVENWLADNLTDLFGCRMANSYLMSLLSQDLRYGGMFTEAQKNKLLYYWAGSDSPVNTKCLSNDHEFILASKLLGRHAFISHVTRLRAYIDSEEGGDYWAKQLYDYVTEDTRLGDFAQISSDYQAAMEKIHKQCMVMYCLSPQAHPADSSRNYAGDFLAKVLMKRLCINCENFIGCDAAQARMNNMMENLMRALVHLVLTSNSSPTKSVTQDIVKELRKQFQDLADAFGITMEQIATEGLSRMIQIARDVMKSYLEDAGSQWDKLFNAVHVYFDAHSDVPEKAWNCLSSVMSITFWAMNMLSTVVVFMGWNDLPSEATIALADNSISAVLKAFASVGPDMLSSFDEACIGGAPTFNWLLNFSDAQASPSLLVSYKRLITEGGSAIGGAKLTLNEAIAKAFASQGGRLDLISSKWVDMFFRGEDLAKATSMLTGTVGCNLIGFQYCAISEISHYEAPSQKATDLIEAAANALARFANEIAVSKESMCLPVNGSLSTLTGMLNDALKQQFAIEPADPTKPPDWYITGKGGNHVQQSLKEPYEEWMDKHLDLHS